MYEVTGESMSQLLLQGCILIFEFTHTETTEKQIVLSDRILECLSVVTALVSIIFGLSSHWVRKVATSNQQTILSKLRLAAINVTDVVSRLVVIFSVMIFSLRWRYGMVAATSVSIIFLLLGWSRYFFLKITKI